MSHSHSHHHHDHHDAPEAGERSAGVRRALSMALALNGAFLAVEVGVGLLTGSLALLSDAAHMVGDVGALALAWGASRLAQRAASPGRSYGWLRAETLGAFANGLMMLGVCGWIVQEAVQRLSAGAPPIAGGPVLVVGLLGLLINLGSALALYRSDRGHLGVRGALLHMAGDALGSLGAMVSAVLLMRGIYAADAVVSLLTAALVLWGSVGLIRDAARVLLQFAPEGVSDDVVRAALLGAEGMGDVHDLHVWTVDGRTPVLSAHLVARPGVSARVLRERAEHLLQERFAIAHTTLQVEDQGECERVHCPLWTAAK